MRHRFRIFLSFASENHPIAAALCHAVVQAHPHWYLFFSTSHIKPGQDFDEVLYRELRSADTLISLWTKEAEASPWCFHELKSFRGQGHRVVPVTPDETPLPDKFNGLSALRPGPGWTGALFPALESALEHQSQLAQSRWRRRVAAWAGTLLAGAALAVLAISFTVSWVRARYAREVADIVRQSLGPAGAVAGSKALARLEGEDPAVMAAGWALAIRQAPRERWQGGASRLALHGRMAITGDARGVVRWWGTHTGRAPQVFPALSSPVLDIRGLQHPNLAAVAFADGRLAVLDDRTFEVTIHEQIRQQVSDPDDIRLAGRGTHAVVIKGGKVWTAGLGRDEAVRRLEEIDFAELTATGPGSTIALAGGSNCWLVDLNGNGRSAMVAGMLEGGDSGARAISALALSADGRWLAVGWTDGHVQRAGSDRRLQTLGAHGGEVRSLACSDSGACISGGRDGTVRVWTVEGRPAQDGVLDGHVGAAAVVALRENAERAVTLDAAGTVRVWSRASGGWRSRSTVLEVEPVDALDLSEDGSTLVTVSRSAVHSWTLGLDPAEVLTRRRAPIDAVAVSRANVVAVRAGDEVQEIHLERVRPLPVVHVDDNLLAIDNDNDAGLCLWRWTKQRLLAECGSGTVSREIPLDTASKRAVALVSDLRHGQILISEPRAVRHVFGERQAQAVLPPGATVFATAVQLGGTAFAFSLGREVELHMGTVSTRLPHPDRVGALAISKDGLTATGCDDSFIRLWNPDGTLRSTLVGHSEWVRHLVFDGTGKRLLSTSEDGTGRVWDVDGDAREAIVLGNEGRDPMTTGAFVPDGRSVITGSMDGTVKRWTLEWSKLREQLRSRTATDEVH